MAKNYNQLWEEADGLKAEGESVANFAGNAAKLPYTLQDEFRKAQDPKLDEAINKAQSDTFGAAIKGLNMYQDISNPFARRDLAEQYQGGVEMGWKNLTDERTRRQGVYADYISKWSGLYGAEAAKRQDAFSNKMALWDREKSLADTEENNRRWEIENARAERSSRGSGSQKDYTEQEITAAINQLKNSGADWETISQFLAEEGVDVSTGAFSDIQLNTAFDSGNYPTKPSSLSPTQEIANMRLAEQQKETEIKRKADEGEDNYYWQGTSVKQKQKKWGIDWFRRDKDIATY